MTNNEIQITIIDREGKSHHLSVPTDMNLNLMEVCRMNDFGVEGTCGGMALCASCQCYVESNHQLSEQSNDELDMLDQAFFVEPNSRLGCQIRITKEIEGLVVRIAPSV
ncbi:MAG TPA: 2Fe-2S iron-sulfur cluster-binding protein [Chitinophagales bacterium]